MNPSKIHPEVVGGWPRGEPILAVADHPSGQVHLAVCMPHPLLDALVVIFSVPIDEGPSEDALAASHYSSME